jgi:hypothetical protein
MRQYVSLLFVSIFAITVSHAEVCDPGVFHGAYGFALTGATTISGATRPVVVVGRMILEDSGNLSGVSSASFVGLLLGNRVTGKYEAQTDCSVTWTFQDPSGSFQHFAGTMSVDGARIVFRQTDLGGPEDGLMLRTMDRCSASSLTATFDFTAAGSTVNVVTAAESGGISLQGLLTADGARNLSFASRPGEPAVAAGTYEVADDCFVALVVDLPVDSQAASMLPGLPQGGMPKSGMHFRAIVVDDGRQVLGMQIDPGTIVGVRLVSE